MEISLIYIHNGWNSNLINVITQLLFNKPSIGISTKDFMSG